MIRALGSLLFYGRFLRSFSAQGYRRRSAGWAAFDPDFSGQTWLVTGATGGIGRRVTLSANAAGATVIAAARNPDKLAALQEDAECRDRLVPMCTDLACMASVAASAGRDELADRV